MADITLPSGIVKPALMSSLYGNKLNLNWDLMDGLFNRVAALEDIHGGAIAGYWPAALGATWDEIQAIMTEAQAFGATHDGGQVVVLPNEPIIMTAGVDILDNPVSLIGAGALSELIVNSGTSISGSQGLFNIAFVSGGMELAGFKITFDRDSLGSSSRRTAIYANWGTNDLDLHHLIINGCTSDIFHLAAEFDENAIANVRIWANEANEWYESYCLLREGNISNVKVFDNVGVTTTRHPLGGVSAPYGVGVDSESLYGLMEDITFENNNVNSTGIAGSGATPGFGIFCAWSGGGTGDTSNIRMNRVTFKKNTVTGFYYNMFFTEVNRTGINPSAVVFEYNDGADATSVNAFYQPQDGTADDHLVLIKNTGGETIDTSVVDPDGPTITQIAA